MWSHIRLITIIAGAIPMRISIGYAWKKLSPLYAPAWILAIRAYWTVGIQLDFGKYDIVACDFSSCEIGNFKLS